MLNSLKKDVTVITFSEGLRRSDRWNYSQLVRKHKWEISYAANRDGQLVGECKTTLTFIVDGYEDKIVTIDTKNNYLMSVKEG